jgi:F0F1-type ATP synthase membrane subunit a
MEDCMTKVLLFIFLLSLPVIAQFNASDFEGFFRGTWYNNTFGSHDSAFVTIFVEESTMSLSLTLDLRGNVFGGSNPQPATMTGSYDQNGFNISGTSRVYGDMFFI